MRRFRGEAIHRRRFISNCLLFCDSLEHGGRWVRVALFHGPIFYIILSTAVINLYILHFGLADLIENSLSTDINLSETGPHESQYDTTQKANKIPHNCCYVGTLFVQIDRPTMSDDADYFHNVLVQPDIGSNINDDLDNPTQRGVMLPPFCLLVMINGQL